MTKNCSVMGFRIGPYIVDLFCPEKKLVIEVDGDVHTEEKQIIKDLEREVYLESLGLCVIRHNNNDILHNLGGVMEDLFRKVI